MILSYSEDQEFPGPLERTPGPPTEAALVLGQGRRRRHSARGSLAGLARPQPESQWTTASDENLAVTRPGAPGRVIDYSLATVTVRPVSESHSAVT
jgi:hypothetical protein